MSQFITLKNYPKAILHVDCDAFFVSCEQARSPILKGKSVITGKERGIVSCASYEAKARGIGRGIRLHEVKKIIPDAIIIPSDYELYSIYSERMFSILRQFSPDVEEYSIDEAFCDITGMRRLYHAGYENIALLIKKRIEKELDITVSIGLSLSKTLAKLCSGCNKPSGIKALPGHEIHCFLKQTSFEEVCGFGHNTVELLRRYGLNNVFDYINKPLDFAESILGKIGRELWLELRGHYVYRINTLRKEKYLSISKTKTFSPASKNRLFVKAQITRNLESACIKLRRHGLFARRLLAYLKTQDFKATGLMATLSCHSSSTMEFADILAGLFDDIFKDGLLYRASGIVLSDITVNLQYQRTLFDDAIRIEKVEKVSRMIDEIAKKYGKHTIHLASSKNPLRKGLKNHPRNSLSWRQKNLQKGETKRQRLNIPLLNLG
ncbi:MAG: DNA polymerase IV [Candidatus Omnitrophota bacterium]